jgi:hypothetical protein
MAIWVIEALREELGTCMRKHRGTMAHIHAHGFTCWHKFGLLDQRVEFGICYLEKQTERGVVGGAHREGRAEHTGKFAGALRWSPTASRGGSPDRESWELRRWLGLRLWKTFLKNVLWAHRTAYSACPVHTGQRTEEKEICARQPVHRTVHSEVSGAHGTVRWAQTEGIFEIFQICYLILNQTKSQLISTQKNTCWDWYWYPHIFSHIFQNILP